MQVELLGVLVPGPGRPGEGRSPVGGLGARLPGSQPVDLPGGSPDVPVTLGVLRRGAAGGEPGVLVAGVVDDEIHNDFYFTFLCFCNQFLHISHRAKFGHDCLIITDIVTIIVVRRFIYGR